MLNWLFGGAASGALLVALAIPALAQSPMRTRLLAPSSSEAGQTVFMMAEVDTQSGAAPIGALSFSDGGQTLGSALLTVRGAGQGTVATGRHTCALTSTGGLKCWGENTFGQLGDGTHDHRRTPGWVSGLTSGIVAVASGTKHSCALDQLGGVKCWGYNGLGQLGDGTNADKPFPVAVSGLSSGVVAIAAGSFHTCALTSEGVIKCWGDNTYGQLANGTRVSSWIPTPVGGGGVYKALSAMSFGGCALTRAGGVECWGNYTARLPQPDRSLGTGFVALASGDSHSCALTVQGGLKCWGDNYYGQLGNGFSGQYASGTPLVSGLASGAIAVDAGGRHTCAVLAAGEVLCWGANDFGQLGRADTFPNSIPGPVVNLGGPAVAVSGGLNNTCVVLASRTLRCWGDNAYGQIGDGTTVPRPTPTTVPALWGVLRGRAQWAASFVAGSHPLRTRYSGDAGHAPSLSPIVQHQAR